MTIDTQKLRDLEAKATKGPWHTKSECPGRCCWHVFKGLHMYGGKPFEDGDNADDPIVMGECSEDDAAFMTAIRNATPALLDRIDALTAALAVAREFVTTARAEFVVTHGIKGVIPADDVHGLAGVAECDAILRQIDAATHQEQS